MLNIEPITRLEFPQTASLSADPLPMLGVMSLHHIAGRHYIYPLILLPLYLTRCIPNFLVHLRIAY